VCVYLFGLHNEDHVCELRIIDYLSHVHDQTVDSFIVDLVLFKLTDVKDANVIEPLAAIESAKNEQLLRTDHTCSVSLAASRCLLTFDRVAPTHGVSVEHIEIIGGNDLFERSTSSIISSK
jgi:hypothetical protein